MVRLDVISPDYECSLILERRITYLRGYSGTGKTSLVQCVNDFNSGDSSVNIVCDRYLSVLLNFRSKDVFLGLKGSIVFIDDALVTETDFFNADIVNSIIENDVYLVIINRVDSKVKATDLAINFSIESILNCKKDGKHHWFVKDYLDGETEDNCSDKYDCIICEDKYGSSDFSKSAFGVKVFPAEGKSNILGTLEKAIMQGYKSIFVFVDCADYGRHFQNFKAYCNKLKNVSVSIDPNYECFEYLLLLSNMLNKEFIFNEDEANSYSSWESYCEAKIEEITKGKMYSYRHGSKVKGCYRKDCDSVCNSYKSSKCDKYVIEDKIPYMFRNAIFDYLISMRDNLK